MGHNRIWDDTEAQLENNRIAHLEDLGFVRVVRELERIRHSFQRLAPDDMALTRKQRFLYDEIDRALKELGL